MLWIIKASLLTEKMVGLSNVCIADVVFTVQHIRDCPCNMFSFRPGAVHATIGLACALWWLRVRFKLNCNRPPPMKGEVMAKKRLFFQLSCEILRFRLEIHIWFTPLSGMLMRIPKRNSRLRKSPKKPSKQVRYVLMRPLSPALLLRVGYSCSFAVKQRSTIFSVWCLKTTQFTLSLVPFWPEFLVVMSRCIWFCLV